MSHEIFGLLFHFSTEHNVVNTKMIKLKNLVVLVAVSAATSTDACSTNFRVSTGAPGHTGRH